MEQLIEYCRRLPHTIEDIKWETNLVFSIDGGRMFCIFSTEKNGSIRVSFKVEDHRFLELSDLPWFIPAPYMARARWITLVDEQGTGLEELKLLIQCSYELYFNKLSFKAQKKLKDSLA